MNTTTTPPIDQVLLDLHPETGKVIQWNEKKRQSAQMAEAFFRISKIDPDFRFRALKMSECASWLEFKFFPESGQKTLNRTNFCRQRICPMCDWRRSLKIYGQTSQIMDVLQSMGYRFLFATMSSKNCEATQMRQEIKRLFDGFTALLRMGPINKSIHGAMRFLEVTHNIDKKNKAYNTYNFHIHAILVVKPSYFRGGKYIKQSQWLSKWRKAIKVDYDPHFDIRAVKKGDSGAVREVSKYATKPHELLSDGDPDLMESGIWHIKDALEGRRLVSYTGIMRKIKSQLNLDDVENGDLIHVDGQTELNEELEHVLVRYGWHVGFNWYTKS